MIFGGRATGSARLKPGAAAARPLRRPTAVRRVRVTARAKLNLGLAVGPRRPDGYHEIATVFQSISLADTLTLSRRRAGDRLEIRSENAAARGRPIGDAVPSGPDNLALRAVRLFRERYPIRGGTLLSLVKRIPAGAGLGGGSADAAATLVGLARLHRVRVARSSLLAMAVELGSDVPFACLGGTAIGLGRGERLRRVRLRRPFHAAVAVPGWRVSTARAYGRIDRGKYGLTLWNEKLGFVQALGRDGVTALHASRMGNAFENALGFRRTHFLSLCERLRAAGFTQPLLTGSGSAVFGVCRHVAALKVAMKRFQGHERLFAVRSVRQGMRVEVAS